MSIPRVTSGAQLGLGCVTFGREIDRMAAFAMLDHAARLGWTHLDTAAAYSNGASERILGEWLAASGLRQRMTLATKTLPPYSASTIPEKVAQSLERLRIDAIDLLYLHRWDATVSEEVIAALDTEVRSGRVRGLALSNFNNEQLTAFVSRCVGAGFTPPRALQNVNNLALRSIDDATRRICTEHGIAILTYSPLGAGFLTGKYSMGVPVGSRFDVIPGHQPLYFTPIGRARLARLLAIAEREHLSPVMLALAWALHQPQVTTVLVGGRSPAHLDQAMQARSLDRPGLLAELGG